MKKPRGFVFKLFVNLLAMAIVGGVLIIGALYWLDYWTLHGKVALVPDVKGDSYSEAVDRLRADGFVVELSDSVYNRHARPGVVVEQSPKVNTKVKPGRTIYLTINAMSPKSVTVPALNDVSLRQARSILEGLGIEHITEVRRPSEFRDLVLAVKLNGVELSAGARIPVTSKITLEVGDGGISGDVSDDQAGEAESSSAIETDDLELI